MSLLYGCSLQNKEVINSCDGKRLGYICDFCIDNCSGKLISISVPERCPGLFGCGGKIIIPWCNIEKIGDDIILVNICESECSHGCRENQKCGTKSKIFDRIRHFFAC